MFTRRDGETPIWLSIEASSEGTLRVATVEPSDRPRLSNIKDFNIEGIPTFTDALQRFERETTVQLRGRDCAMAIAGATSGENLSLVRSRWTISRAGLEAVFGKPVIIVNDVAARAWAIKSGTANIETIRGTGAPDLVRSGRYIMLMVEEGVNAAIIDVDRHGAIRVLETEAGNIEFAPTGDGEVELARAVRGTLPAATWEQILMLDRQSTNWTATCPEMNDSERGRFLAEALGRFCVNLMHAHGAWRGVMTTGGRAAKILSPTFRPALDKAFNVRRNFTRLVAGCPVWHVVQRDAVLTGTAECLASALNGSSANHVS